jgi:hypothetical protein
MSDLRDGVSAGQSSGSQHPVSPSARAVSGPAPITPMLAVGAHHNGQWTPRLLRGKAPTPDLSSSHPARHWQYPCRSLSVDGTFSASRRSCARRCADSSSCRRASKRHDNAAVAATAADDSSASGDARVGSWSTPAACNVHEQTNRFVRRTGRQADAAWCCRKQVADFSQPIASLGIPYNVTDT